MFDARIGGATVPAVAVSSKNGLLFFLNRVSGAPIHAIEERPVPASDVPGEAAAPTQPYPARDAAAGAHCIRSRRRRSSSRRSTRSGVEHWIADKQMVAGGLYRPRAPQSAHDQLSGSARRQQLGRRRLDPTTGLLYLNTSDLGQVTELVPSTGPLAYERGPTSGRFMQQTTRLPCQKPPWGQLHAIDTATGLVRWQATLGVSDNLPVGKQDTGRPNIGGPIVTAGGLVFIGATDDNRFRAFDARSGRLLWSHTLRSLGARHTDQLPRRGRSPIRRRDRDRRQLPR